MLSFDARRVQGALFDLDGTLVDSLPDLHFAVCEVLKSWGLEPMEEEEVGRYIGKGAIHLAAEVLRARKPDATAEERDRFVKEYVNTLAGMGCSHTRAIPGVLEALGIFRSEGLKLALVTNKAGVLIDAVLEQAPRIFRQTSGFPRTMCRLRSPRLTCCSSRRPAWDLIPRTA